MSGYYHYAVVTRVECRMQQAADDAIDMENVDYKRQPDAQRIRRRVADAGGFNCGIIRGGMFGLRTNQVAVLTAWRSRAALAPAFESLRTDDNWTDSNACWLSPTVRPLAVEAMERPGIYVIRWIRMAREAVEEYTRLCVETWPAFETMARARCYGVFTPIDSDGPVITLLMLTWYATLADWEQSRALHAPDAPRWARRSELELAHWAEAGRLA